MLPSGTHPGFGLGAAIADYNAAIALMKRMRDRMGEDWPVPWRNSLAGAYVNRGAAKHSAFGFGPGAAIADYDAAVTLMVALRDRLGEGWPTPWRNDLATAYMNRALPSSLHPASVRARRLLTMTRRSTNGSAAEHAGRGLADVVA